MVDGVKDEDVIVSHSHKDYASRQTCRGINDMTFYIGILH